MKVIAPRSFFKVFGSLFGLLVLLALLAAANVLLARVRARVDLTEEKLYTLSEGTRGVLKALEAPVTLKFFFSGSAPDVPAPLKQYGQQVVDLLKEYQTASGGRVTVETYDPKPDSDAEEWAQRYGLTGEQLGLGDALFYLGLVAERGDTRTVAPMLDPRQEETLEYTVTRLIARVANPRKPVLGLLSSLPVMGVRAFPYAMPGQPRPQSQPPWLALHDLEKDYDVRQLSADLEAVDPAIETLVLIHPKELSDRAWFAVDQFVLRGGRLLAFVDPLCLADAMNQDQPAMMGMPNVSSDLGPLTAAWGLTYDRGRVVADIAASTRVRRGDRTIEDNPVFLSLQAKNINGADLLTASLESLGMPTAGAIGGTGVEGLQVGSLLVSSEQSSLVGAMTAQMGAEAVRREFSSGLKRLNLAVRIEGTFPTAFPKGKPAKEPAGDGADDADEADEAKPDSEQASSEPALAESRAPGLVVLVADVDLLYDAFAAQELPLFGQRVYQPINDNLAFFANALERLTGGADLSRIRTRGRLDRPFDRVLELQRTAQERWLEEERRLQERLDATQQRLAGLQTQKDTSQRYILSPEQKEEIARFKQEQVKTQRELKQVRKNLREGIESLGVKVKAVNILAMPALVCLAGLAFGWLRRR